MMGPTVYIGHAVFVMNSRTNRWRTVLGTSLFVLGCVLPLFIPLLYLLPLNGWWLGALTALFALGLPELLWFLAALLIGKDGLIQLKDVTKAMARRVWNRFARK